MIECSTKEIANLFTVNPATITKWRKAGMPGKVSKNRWNLKQVFDWWIENVHGGADRSGDSGLSEARRRYWQSKAEMGELRAAEMRGELIPIEEIEQKWAQRVAAVCAMMELLASRLPGLLAGKSRREMAKIIEDEVWSIRDAYASQGAR